MRDKLAQFFSKQRKWLVVLAVAVVFTGIAFYPVTNPVEVKADKLTEVKKEIELLEAKLKEIQGQKQSLSQVIDFYNTKIQLTQSEINKTQAEIEVLEGEIGQLSGKINLLNVNLEKISGVMVNRINASYKNGRQQPLFLLLISDGFSDFFRRLKYLKVSQQNDREVIFALEEARANFDVQKQFKEKKQAEVTELQDKLLDQKNDLAAQRAGKEHLMAVTRNDEKKYQELLSQARAEYTAIQNIVAGKGTETLVGPVNAGDVIASVIPGASCNSSGAHLHFIVRNRTTRTPLNPFSYLSPDISYQNCSGPGACSPGDPFNPSGTWGWPIPPIVKLTQGYGSTWAVRNTWVGQIYSFHNGIDIVSTGGMAVFAVQGGTLYRGSYNVGCALRYVRVEHTGSELDSMYLHVNF